MVVSTVFYILSVEGLFASDKYRYLQKLTAHESVLEDFIQSLCLKLGSNFVRGKSCLKRICNILLMGGYRSGMINVQVHVHVYDSVLYLKCHFHITRSN